MSVTSSGLRCDVCGNFILPILDDVYERFGVKGIEGELQCHMRCKQTLIDCRGDWKSLPGGPLRTAFAEAARKLEEPPCQP